MKATKFAPEVVNDNDFRDYQNLPNISQKERNQNQRKKEHQCQTVNNSEEVLIGNYMYGPETVFNLQTPEANANRFPSQDFELVCNCPVSSAKKPPEQTLTLSRSCCTTPKLGERSCSQFSLDRRHQKLQKHYVCESLRRNPSVKRLKSPEIINTHLGPGAFLYDGYGPENCSIKSYGYDKDPKNDDYGFRRGPSFGRASERSDSGIQLKQKKRVAGDGMDSEMDDPEVLFEPGDHLRACRCPCDHVIYSPGYNCLQVIGPAHIKLLSVKLCPDVDPKVSLDLHIKDYNETAQLLSGSLYFPFLIDNDFKVTLRGMKLEDGQWVPDKTYINKKSLCRIIDNYIWEMAAKSPQELKSESVCPLVGGVYHIQDFSPKFDKLELPAEMFGHQKFLLQIENSDEVYICQELEFENSLKNQDLLY